VGVPDAGQTDLVTGSSPYNCENVLRPLSPSPPFIQENAVGIEYFIGGGAGRACMEDLVVTS